MKKLKLSRSKNKPSKVKIHRSGLHSVIAIPLVILVAIGGVITLKFSLADSNVYGVQIVMHDSNLSKNIPGINITLANSNSGNQPCAVMQTSTDSAGSASFYGCPASTSYTASFNVTPNGYEARAQVLGGGTKPITSIAVITGNPSQGSYSSYVVNLYPIDTDGDGVPNNTPGYPVDKCPTVAGPSSNSGCPLPAPAPPAPAPSQPPSSSGGTTTKKPSTATNTTTTKTTSASNTKSAPAVVAATTGDTTPPTAPQNLTISQIDQSLFLSWDESSDNVGVAGYNIERSTDNENWTPVSTKISDTFYSDENLNSSDKHYYYRVQAVDAAGNSSEGVLNDIRLTANKSSDTKTKTAVSAAKKKSSSGLVVSLTIGILLILAALLGAFFLLRRRLGSSQSPYYGDSDINYSTPAAPNAVIVSPQQPTAGHDPRYDVGPPAPHTAVSLKEMVMENREKHNHDQTPQG